MNREPLNILLVEDDEDDAFYIKDLIREGMPSPLPRVDHTSTAAEAESRLERNLYDLCLFDYRLGEVDGIDLLRTVRGRNITVPIILLTGQGDQEIAVEAMKAGATDYLTKSKLSTETLTHSIRYALGLHREAERRKETEKMLKESHEELKVAHEELQASMRKLQTAQKQILRSEKLAGIGRLAAGVCHEILNPLNIISGHIQALAMEREDDGSLMDDLNSIMEEVQRIEKIISGLLKFSRKGDMELKHMDINKELESVLSILEKDMNLDGVQVFRQFDPDLPPLLADGDRMRQVFLN
ncbi:MAG: response regulator, partial [Nitrospinaceae bacterium]|nr:response regulator [Nitrospinaceae bacterium]NIR54508.1 response regulator [Nitrospinaceae bacterium]NIS84927.1 response regulator [Nitrospinaceae bacterium]NIT81741.1 response regulator [Nitrospinaceae bacterium]NIU44010.1 response regulator [Nitrospinaceae bacterium]